MEPTKQHTPANGGVRAAFDTGGGGGVKVRSQTLNSANCPGLMRLAGKGAFVLGFGAFLVAAEPVPEAQANPAMCRQLEAQLANLAQPRVVNPREARRYERAILEQEQNLREVDAQYHQAQCSGGVFERGGARGVCRGLTRAKRQMRRNLEQLKNERGRHVEMVEDPRERARIESQMARLRCDRGFRHAGYPTEDRPRGFFGWLFGGGDRRGMYDSYGMAFRTVCVRHYDGFFVPISFATTPQFFETDAARCQEKWPEHSSELFVFTLPDQTLEDAVSINGNRPYMSLENALRFKREYVDPDKTEEPLVADGATQQSETLVASLAGPDTDITSAILPDLLDADAIAAGLQETKDTSTEDAREPANTGDETGGVETAAWPQSPAPQEEDTSSLPLAKTGFRDVFKQPFVTSGELATSASAQRNRYPPLPPRRPVTATATEPTREGAI